MNTLALLLALIAHAQAPCAELRGEQLIPTGAVSFATGKPDLVDSDAAIASVACALAADPSRVVQVEVHTDSRGSEVYNLKISQDRAESVRAALIAAGVPAERVIAAGYGESVPLDTNQTAEGRVQNRRVEFHTDPSGRPARPELPEPSAPAPPAPPAPDPLCAVIERAVASGGGSRTTGEPLRSLADRVSACLDSSWSRTRDGDALYAENGALRLIVEAGVEGTGWRLEAAR